MSPKERFYKWLQEAAAGQVFTVNDLGYMKIQDGEDEMIVVDLQTGVTFHGSHLWSDDRFAWNLADMNLIQW